MDEKNIHITDWLRILAGNVPPSFYAELAIRASFIYILLLVSMRLMGKRMAAQLSRLDMAAMVALASAIGVPMLTADRGLLPPVIIAVMVVSLVRMAGALSVRYTGLERLLQGEPDLLVKDGVLQPKVMITSGMSRERILAQLRSKQLVHTGQVKRLYLESGGSFTLTEEKKPQAGLLVLPEWDTSFIPLKSEKTQQVICHYCGQPQPTAPAENDACSNCRHKDWAAAVTEKK